MKGFVAVFLAAGMLLAHAGAAQAETRAQFCARWHAVCTRCDGLGASVPRAQCLRTCSGRLATCKRTGCYHFNDPGPMCQGR